MELNDLETKVILEFLKRFSLALISKEDLKEHVHVLSRDETGAGFFTALEHTQCTKVAEETKDFKWGGIGALINDKVDVGFLLDIKNGYLSCVEGYTYSDDWPKVITKVELYDISSS